MSAPLRVSLIGDGSSDRCLWPVIVWSVHDRFGAEVEIASAGFVARAGQAPVEILEQVLHQDDPDLVVFHRDAEGEEPEIRLREIPSQERVVPVIPVRMTEAWLLFDAAAIARAADNPSFTGMNLPRLARVESLPDPKEALNALLIEASDLSGNRTRQRFHRDLGMRRAWVADYIESFAPLRELSAFRAFETALHGWIATWLSRDRRGPGARSSAQRAGSR